VTRTESCGSKTNRRDLAALITTIGVACLMCPVTVALIRNPNQMWLYAVLEPSTVLSVWLCTRRWGVRCDSFGIRPPVKLRWHLIGLLRGLLMPFGLLPLWQTLGMATLVPPVEILPLIFAVPAWDQTAFRGMLFSVLLALLGRDTSTNRLPLIGRRRWPLFCQVRCSRRAT
jgi:hypothetical protein